VDVAPSLLPILRDGEVFTRGIRGTTPQVR
jgi:hypothetical protein